MSNLEELKRQHQNAQDLQTLVKTMKALALASIHQYEEASASLTEYHHTIQLGLRAVLRQHAHDLSSDPRRLPIRSALIAFGSDQGLCGPLNERLTTFIHDTIQTTQRPHACIAVGERIADHLEAISIPVQRRFAVPSSLSGVNAQIQELLFCIETLRTEQEINQITLFTSEHSRQGSILPLQVQLWPIDQQWLQEQRHNPWPTRSIPTFAMPWQDLMASLIQQHLFVTLYHALVESLASEHASRLASMQAAEHNIEELLASLKLQRNQTRQNAITSEILDIVGGFEALQTPRRKARRKAPPQLQPRRS